MVTEARIGIESVERISDDSVLCVVRCLAGSVSPGDVFRNAVLDDGAVTAIDLRVDQIWRYGRMVDLLDPPHAAKIELSGAVSYFDDVKELRGEGES